MKDILIADRYRVDRKIGVGGCGIVYSASDLQTGEEVAVKLTYTGDGPAMLQLETQMYEELAGGSGIPRMRFSGSECDFCVLVHDLLGPSLEDLFNYCGGRFSLKTVLLIADQAVSRIQHIHAKGILHRDIKPDNFLMGLGRHGNTLYTIDFGLARRFAGAGQDGRGLLLGGTRLFASIRNHGGCAQSWGDDLECLGYVLLYFARGSLPWKDLDAAGNRDDDDRIREMKESLSGEVLCHDAIPTAFAACMDHVRSLGFGEKPDYAYLRGSYRRVFAVEGFKYDKVFDWTEKRFQETYSKTSKTTAASRSRPKPQKRKPRKSRCEVYGGHPQVPWQVENVQRAQELGQNRRLLSEIADTDYGILENDALS